MGNHFPKQKDHASNHHKFSIKKQQKCEHKTIQEKEKFLTPEISNVIKGATF